MARTTKVTGEKQDLFEAIAIEHLGIETLETRRSDELDFPEVAVWQLRKALEAAYAAGAADARRTKGARA